MAEVEELARWLSDTTLADVRNMDDARAIAHRELFVFGETHTIIDNLAAAILIRARQYHGCKRVDRVVPVMGSIYCGCPICDPDD